MPPTYCRRVCGFGVTSLISLVVASGCGATDAETAPPPYTGEPLDCQTYPSAAAGNLEGHKLRGRAQSRTAVAGDSYWYVHGSIDEYDVSAWSVPGGAAQVGHAHFTSSTTGEQLCVDRAESNPEFQFGDEPRPSVSFFGFSSLGSCGDVQGSTSTLYYCEAFDPQGPVPERDCVAGQTRVSGDVSGSYIDEKRGRAGAISTVFAPAFSLDSYFSGGGRLTYDTQPGGGRKGFLRMELGGVMKVFCVQDVTDAAPNDEGYVSLRLDVIELGNCPGAALAGGVSACFFYR